METLLTGAEIGAAVQALFAVPHGGRRVVITAYVGADPVPLLGDVRGVEVYCSPSPTGTSAVGVRRLKDAGAMVYFSKHLHMKAYWVEGRGALIGSANLSANGLAEGLAEVLVLLPDNVVHVDALIGAFKGEIQHADDEAIEELRKGNDACRRHANVGESAFQEGDGAPGAAPVSFVEWDRWRREGKTDPVKLGWFDRKIDTPSSLVAAAEAGGFLDGVEDFNAARHSKTYGNGDWVLMVRVQEGKHARTLREVSWLHVDGVKTLSPKEGRAAGLGRYVHAAWEGTLDPRRQPPFELTNKSKRAVREVWKQLAPAWIGKGDEVPESVLTKVPDVFFDKILAVLASTQD